MLMRCHRDLTLVYINELRIFVRFLPSEMNAKGVILNAFERYRLKTCIDFKPWSGETNYISVFKGSGYVKSVL